ncbi:hypothetical protein BKA69DRAFT_591761 [Paraphysoderma sedebokerense]|nr:hypothetical protein BKA69DRAFT_591761 [Paraphysoderma sedebokerense]
MHWMVDTLQIHPRIIEHSAVLLLRIIRYQKVQLPPPHWSCTWLVSIFAIADRNTLNTVPFAFWPHISQMDEVLLIDGIRSLEYFLGNHVQFDNHAVMDLQNIFNVIKYNVGNHPFSHSDGQSEHLPFPAATIVEIDENLEHNIETGSIKIDGLGFIRPASPPLPENPCRALILHPQKANKIQAGIVKSSGLQCQVICSKKIISWEEIIAWYERLENLETEGEMTGRAVAVDAIHATNAFDYERLGPCSPLSLACSEGSDDRSGMSALPADEDKTRVSNLVPEGAQKALQAEESRESHIPLVAEAVCNENIKQEHSLAVETNSDNFVESCEESRSISSGSSVDGYINTKRASNATIDYEVVNEVNTREMSSKPAGAIASAHMKNYILTCPTEQLVTKETAKFVTATVATDSSAQFAADNETSKRITTDSSHVSTEKSTQKNSYQTAETANEVKVLQDVKRSNKAKQSRIGHLKWLRKFYGKEDKLQRATACKVTSNHINRSKKNVVNDNVKAVECRQNSTSGLDEERTESSMISFLQKVVGFVKLTKRKF